MTSSTRIFPEHLTRILPIILPMALAACQTSPQPAVNPRLSLTVPAKAGPQNPASDTPAKPVGPPSTADLISDPQRFKGMSGAEVTALLGRPSFQRKDADAEIWQYYGPASNCVLDLFVYPEADIARVAHAELRARGSGAASACLAQIIDGKRG